MNNNYAFISYSSKNYDSAKRIYDEMTAKGIRCWFDEVSIIGGENYAANIIKAIESCNTFILVLSKDAMASRNVASELNTAFQSGKLIVPFRIDNEPLTDDFEYYLNRSQWIDADSKVREAIDELYTVVSRQFSQQSNSVGRGGSVSYDTQEQSRNNKKKRNWIPIVCGVGGGVILLVVLMIVLANVVLKKFTTGVSNLMGKTENAVSNAQNWVDDTLGNMYSELDDTISGVEDYANGLAEEINNANSSEAEDGTSDISDSSNQADNAGNQADNSGNTGNGSSQRPGSELVGIFELPLMEQVNTELQKKVKNTTGYTYYHAYVLSSGNGVSSATFYLGGNYDDLTFDVSCPDIGSTNGFNWDVKVYLDGDIDNPEVIYDMTKSFATHTLTVDTRGAQTITIWCEQITLEYTGVMITNTLDTDPDNVMTTPYDTGAESGMLLDQPLMESYFSEIKKNVTNNVGTSFDRGLLLAGDNSRSIATLYLGKRFDEVTFNVSCPSDEYVSPGFTYRVYIYLDGQFDDPVKVYNMSMAFPPETITLDTQGATTIAFFVEQKLLEKSGVLITEVE